MRSRTAYPRACGATSAPPDVFRYAAGLPPRVRGNLGRTDRRLPPVRPTPARAGQPGDSSESPSAMWAYPRACGATEGPTPMRTDDRGLPPRVRGNHERQHDRGERQRPTPARAGQPPATRGSTGTAGAYPRACGATGAGDLQHQATDGLPPRVRGNHGQRGQPPKVCGPTPARAGQPGRSRRSTPSTTAYPRACGATGASPRRPRRDDGLPPRVRGNRVRRLALRVDVGPTPARAGQPLERRGCVRVRGAYPRACGATGIVEFAMEPFSGLPPRVRGNLAHDRPDALLPRPTPARAGQPRSRPRAASPPRAYPRACGATGSAHGRRWLVAGLPPRVRGNPHPGGRAVLGGGPTPARAGQPWAFPP